MKATRPEPGSRSRLQRVRPGCLTQPLRHVEGLTDGPPHSLRIHAVSECLVHRAAAQPGQHEILGHTVRVGVAELRPHPLPEHCQAHGARLPAAGAARGGRTAAKQLLTFVENVSSFAGKIFNKHVANRVGARDDPPGRIRERTVGRPGNRGPTRGTPGPATGTTRPAAGTGGPVAGITGSPAGSSPIGAPAAGGSLPAESACTAGRAAAAGSTRAPGSAFTAGSTCASGSAFTGGSTYASGSAPTAGGGGPTTGTGGPAAGTSISTARIGVPPAGIGGHARDPRRPHCPGRA